MTTFLAWFLLLPVATCAWSVARPHPLPELSKINNAPLGILVRNDELRRDGFMILDDFVSDAQLQNLIQSDLVRLQEEGKFTTAKVGSVANVNQEIRVAETCFLQKQRPNPIRTLVLDRLGQLRHELSLIQPIEPELDDFLYIHYPQGGFYNKHVDATPNTPSDLRIYSVLLYLNTVQQGGQLRLFLDNDSIKDIVPKAGRLVVLDSHRIPHQVMETKEPRRVLVGWFHRAPTHEELLTYATSS